MILQNFINERLIDCDIKSKDKYETISVLVDLLFNENIIQDKERFINIIKKREKIESTGIGDGIAIPHGKDNSVKKTGIAFGRSCDGINFDSLDGKPVHLIFLVASPLEARKEYLQVVAKIARLLKSTIMRENLMKADNPFAVIKIIKEFDEIAAERIKVKTKKGRAIHGEEKC